MAILRIFRVFTLLVASILLMSSWSAPARAALSWEFGFDGTVDNFSGTGSFTLGGDEGPPSTLTAFEFSGICGLSSLGRNVCELGIDDVVAANWVLLPDWTFESLFIRAQAAFPDDRFISFLELDESSLSLECSSSFPFENECNGLFADQRTDFFPVGAFLRPIHEVPEPASIGLFLLGLSALAIAGLKPRRRRPSGETQGAGGAS